MAQKNSFTTNLEDNLASRAPISPCGFIYCYSVDQFPIAEASLLANKHVDSSVFALPLLYGLTVDDEFQCNVKAIHKKINTNTLAVKVSSFHREIIIFHNGQLFNSIFLGPGLETVCNEARDLFGFSKFTPRSLPDTLVTKDLFPFLEDPAKWIMGVVVTEAFKERLFWGKLCICSALVQETQVGDCHAFKLPLFDMEMIVTCDNLPLFYFKEVSQYLYNSLYTAVAQAIRVKDVDAIISALEEQTMRDKYKIPKVSHIKIYPTQPKNNEFEQLMIIDALSSELALSYGMSFLEGPQETTDIMHYSQWPILEGCVSSEEKIQALTKWNANMALHINAHIFSVNSVLYLTKVLRQAAKPGKVESNSLNSFYLQHGLGYLTEPMQKENGDTCFSKMSWEKLVGQIYTIHHLAYAASMSPQTLARHCFYLQFAQNQKASTNQSFNIPNYVGTTANTSICHLCSGNYPGSCLNTLFFRLKDRFPSVLSPQKRDPYILSGVVSPYNDLDYLGNFATFKEKDDDHGDDTQRYTYWQMTQNLMERLDSLGISDDVLNNIKDVHSFIKTFKDIDSSVEAEALKFINSLVKNNVNFRESIKASHHVFQYYTNVFWQPPCSAFLLLYYKTILTVIQDICFPLCMTYEQENPGMGMMPSDWLKSHFQTVWTNFKAMCFDKGIMTGSEMRVVHKEQICEYYDIDLAVQGNLVPAKYQVKISRASLLCPKQLKIKNRVLFTNSGGAEAMQANFIKNGIKKDYILNGPYAKFLCTLHKNLFPSSKMSALYMWHTFTQKKKLPVLPGVNEADLKEFGNFIDTNSKLYEESNVIDIIPNCITSYAKLKLNNVILRHCGQTQFYISTIQPFLSCVNNMPGSEFPHVLGSQKISSPEDYCLQIGSKTVPIIQTTIKHNLAQYGKLRPIVTAPILINKYTGIKGNSDVFFCGSLGYFIGRGIDKNLLQEFGNSRKNSVPSFMRKRYLFVSPMYDYLAKKPSNINSTFEIECLRKKILDIIIRCENYPLTEITLELVKALGPACKNITEQDVIFYMGDYHIFSEDVFQQINTLIQQGCDWSTEHATTLLKEDADCEPDTFIDFSQPKGESSQKPEEIPAKKRKITAFLNELDL